MLSQSEDLVKNIKERREMLKKSGENLKAYFVGLDEVIDKIIKYMEVWYVMPELLTRPCIINLWGMTGVGKTDLVRRLVKELNYVHNFLEIQMTNDGSTSHFQKNIHEILEYSNIEPSKPGILLLDEWQRFRSVDETGQEIHDYKLQDVWMLLSDGKFSNSSDNKDRMYQMLFDILYNIDLNDARKKADKLDDSKQNESVFDDEDEDEDSDISKHRKFKRSYLSSQHFKKICRLEDSVEDIMRWDSNKKLNILQNKIKDQSSYEGDNYSKMLIFVSGNIDEAYVMANEIDESDIDADLFHKHSKRINMLSIKSALRNRFKPEQIARLGNNHVIYHSLSRKNYEDLIKKRISEVVKDVKSNFDISVDVDYTINHAIYNNGVFPVQGTRPLFSTISSFFESSLPVFVLKALEKKESSISVFYQDNFICAEIGNESYKLKNEGDLDTIKRNKHNIDRHVATSLHEAGHAVLYAILFKKVPTQIAVNVASENSNGFVGLHNMNSSYSTLLNKIAVLLAGRTIEEIVFGSESVTGGAISDLKEATCYASTIVRQLGMKDRLSRIRIPYLNAGCEDPNNASNEIEGTDKYIEKILKEQKDRANVLLKENIDLVRDVANILISKLKIDLHDFKSICENHNVECEIINPETTIYETYREKYVDFFGSITDVASYDDIQRMKIEESVKKVAEGKQENSNELDIEDSPVKRPNSFSSS